MCPATGCRPGPAPQLRNIFPFETHASGHFWATRAIHSRAKPTLAKPSRPLDLYWGLPQMVAHEAAFVAYYLDGRETSCTPACSAMGVAMPQIQSSHAHGAIVFDPEAIKIVAAGAR